uniref:Secreted protein n=1 Tax=Anopheles darlingi TaxID=43151 RepID=A0A2M4DFW6_ANODA
MLVWVFVLSFFYVPPLCRGSRIDSIPKWSKQNKYQTQTILLENTVCVLLFFDFLFLLLSIPNFLRSVPCIFSCNNWFVSLSLLFLSY